LQRNPVEGSDPVEYWRRQPEPGYSADAGQEYSSDDVLVQQPPDPVTVEQQKGDEDADGEPVKSPMKRASERLKKGLVIGDNCVVGGNVQEECERRQDQQNEDAILVAATSKDEQRHRNERRGDVELFLAAQRPERNNDIRRQIIPQKHGIAPATAMASMA
jgi:hypothetical protein